MADSGSLSQHPSHAPVLAIVGPTASGKTAAALSLAKQFDIEIINVDSGQVYQQMDIGTAKPTAEERASVRHWLIDVRDPADAYSAAAFCDDAVSAIADIRQRQRIPVLVGGTLFYLNALEQGLGHTPPVPPAIRQSLRERFTELGAPAMHAQLKDLDAPTAARLHVNDSQRILRAMEVLAVTGKPMPARSALSQHLNIKKIALVPSNRKHLHDAIHLRFTHMVASGLIDEVRLLMQRPDLSLEQPSMRSIGYRQVWEYLSGIGNEQDMVNKAVAATRQLAKRQLTWLRGMRGVVWMQSDSPHSKTALDDYVRASRLA